MSNKFLETAESLLRDPKVHELFVFFPTADRALMGWAGAFPLAKTVIEVQPFPFWNQPQGFRGEIWRAISKFKFCARSFEEFILTKVKALPLGKHFLREGWTEDAKDWLERVQKIKEAIGNGTLNKVVLSRWREKILSEVEQETLLSRIIPGLSGMASENSYRLLIKSGDSIFISVTPELLFRRSQGMISVPAIAGTKSLEKDKPEHEQFELLLKDPKEREEHQFVVEGICEALRALGLHPTCGDAPTILKWNQLAHPHTSITCKDPGIDALSHKKLIQSLHPTPAIGGTPRETALDFLRENEGWDRGYFSAPILIDHEEQTLCLVAIRSALFYEGKLTQFAGAGIVRNSDPAKEWDETSAKMNSVIDAIFSRES